MQDTLFDLFGFWYIFSDEGGGSLGLREMTGDKADSTEVTTEHTNWEEEGREDNCQGETNLYTVVGRAMVPASPLCELKHITILHSPVRPCFLLMHL